MKKKASKTKPLPGKLAEPPKVIVSRRVQPRTRVQSWTSAHSTVREALKRPGVERASGTQAQTEAGNALPDSNPAWGGVLVRGALDRERRVDRAHPGNRV